MKAIITFFLLISSFLVTAQDTTRFQAQLAKMYGTPAEKVQQNAIERQSESQYLCRLIGFKEYYLNEIASFLQLQGFRLVDVPDKKGFFLLSLSKNGVYMGIAKAKKVTLIFAVDDNERIKYGTIKGSFSDLANLFINYWPQDAEWLSEVKLQPGVVAQKHSFGDLITFNWSAGVPYIHITKDPNISFIPPLLVK